MKNKCINYMILIILFSSSFLFGQVASGPDTGSIASGVIVSTDNFTLIPIGLEPPKEQRVVPLTDFDSGPLHYIGTQEAFDNYVYVEDKNTDLPSGTEIGINFELHSFPSIPMTNSIPPDNHMAVGPNHVITMVNSRFHIYDREGVLLKNIDADNWTSQVLPNPGAFDPQIIYDHFEERWFMLWDSYDAPTLTAYFLISYSDDSNPLGTWYMYALDATVNGSDSTATWGDYPQIGYDDQAIYINSRQFPFSGGGQIYNKIRILNKTELYAAQGGSLTWTDFWDIRRPTIPSIKPDVIHPSISYEPGLNAAYFFWSNYGQANFYILYKISNPVTNPVLTGIELPVPYYFQAPLANQLGGGAPRIETGGSRTRSAPIVRDSLMYAVHGIRNSLYANYGSLKYVVININTNQVLDQSELGADGYFFFYPALTVDQDHNVAITFSRSADTEYAGSYYSTRLGTDPPGLLSRSKTMIEGQGNYIVTFGGSRNRWGDYLCAGLDPVNQYDIWLYSEYAAHKDTWGTWLTEIRMKPYSGVSLYTESNPIEFGDIEIGSIPITKVITISNYGDADLIINNINSPAGPFTLLTPLNFPDTLSTFDSLDLEIQFDPSTPAIYSELMQFDDNDPNFNGLMLNGTGFEMNPAFTGAFYASTGVNENGKMLSINKTTGLGSELGLSNFNDLSSLSIDPITSIIYGISSGQNETELVRVNGTGGDGFTQHVLGLGTVAGISFDTSGVFYAAQTIGNIYSIDLSNGSHALVSTANLQLSAIAINPLTNEMWAVPKVVFGAKDKIYKINLTTGQGTLIGQTGLGLLTNDITFDENGDLYGIIGEASDVGKLISIDTSTAVGTVIGDIGFQHVLGLGYAVNGLVNSVNTGDDTKYPEDFVLSQNYPNPFNPNTLIEFSIPVNAKVKLTIYNILGQVITTLLDEELGSGQYNVSWNGLDNTGNIVSSGIYIYELKASGSDGVKHKQMKKMILLR